MQTFKGHTGNITSATFLNEGKYLISASTDNTLKFWDIATGSELITLIILGDEDWAAVTPDGRFDGSLNGLKKLHYSQGMKTIPLDAFFEQFYTSRLLSRVLWGEDVIATHPVLDLSKQIKLPPLVEIVSPKSEQSFSANQLTITVKTTNQGGGIDEIRLYQNSKLVDKTIRGFQLSTEQDTYIISSFNVILVAGRNEFRATAFNQDRTESEPAVIRIELTAPKPTADFYIIDRKSDG